MLFLLLKLFCLGICFTHGLPSQGPGLLTREKRPSLSRGPRRTVPSGKLGFVMPITISLNLSLDFLCVGHEHPYAIQKSNLPATVLEDSTTDDTQETREIPGQFILKPRHPTTLTALFCKARIRHMWLPLPVYKSSNPSPERASRGRFVHHPRCRPPSPTCFMKSILVPEP